MCSYGPPHMAKQKQDDQLEHTYNSCVRIRDVVLKTCQKRWMIGRSGERGSGISVLVARHDDDDDDDDELFGQSCNIFHHFHPKMKEDPQTTWTHIAQAAGAVEYTDCTSAEGKDPTPPMSDLDVTLNNIMVRFQWCWGFGERGAHPYCHFSHGHPGPGMEAPGRALNSQIITVWRNWIPWNRNVFDN